MMAQGSVWSSVTVPAARQFQPGDERAGDGGAAQQIAGGHAGIDRRQEAREFVPLGAIVQQLA